MHVADRYVPMCILLILYTWTTICSSPWHTSGDTKNEGAGGCLRCLLNPTAAVRNLVQSVCCFWSQHRAKLIPANILFLGQLLQFARFKNSARAISMYQQNQGVGHQIAPKIHIGFGLIQAFCNNHHLQWLCSQWHFIKSCHPRLPGLIFFTA